MAGGRQQNVDDLISSGLKSLANGHVMGAQDYIDEALALDPERVNSVSYTHLLVKLLTAYWPSTSFAIMCRHFGCLALADDASQI